MQGQVMAHHETINRRHKKWGIISQVFRHNIRRHGKIFQVCTVITQLTIKNGKLLFKVEYKD
jgi:hypothetical protein